MLTPLKWVGKEDKTLIVKMTTHNGSVEATKTNLVNLCDVDTILGLACILLMLKSFNILMKFAKPWLFLCVIILQLLKSTKLICIKCKLIQPFHFNLKIFLNSKALLQTLLVRSFKIG